MDLREIAFQRLGEKTLHPAFKTVISDEKKFGNLRILRQEILLEFRFSRLIFEEINTQTNLCELHDKLVSRLCLSSGVNLTLL